MTCSPVPFQFFGPDTFMKIRMPIRPIPKILPKLRLEDFLYFLGIETKGKPTSALNWFRPSTSLAISSRFLILLGYPDRCRLSIPASTIEHLADRKPHQLHLNLASLLPDESQVVRQGALSGRAETLPLACREKTSCRGTPFRSSGSPAPA